MKYFLLSTILCLSLAPLTSLAYELRVHPDITISEDYISEENLYLVGITTNFNTTHEEDVVSVSLDQTIEGTVFGDVTLVGNDILVSGEVFGDTRILANQVTITGVVNKDLVIIANNVVISDNAIINGDLLVLSNSIYLGGQYLGQNKVTANTIAVHGEIVGSTAMTGQRITFNSGSRVVSEISYFSPQRAYVESGSSIEQAPNFNQIESIGENDMVKRVFFSFISFWYIIKLVATFFVILILTQLFKIFSQRVSDTLLEKKWSVLVTGFFATILFPILIIVLFSSLVFIPISIILAFAFGTLLILLPAMTAILIGQIYQVYVLKKSRPEVNFNISVLTLIILTFFAFIPYIGSAFVYLAYLGAFGSMIQYLYGQIRRKKIKL